MERKAHLRELGLNETANRENLILAYRRLMLQWHPERAKSPESLESKGRFLAISLAFSALERNSPSTASRARKASQPFDIAATYGAPRFQNTSFEATSLNFLPARSITELGLTSTPRNTVTSTSHSTQKANPPIRSTVLIGGAIGLLLFMLFALVREETQRRFQTLERPAPIVTLPEKTESRHVEITQATPPVAASHGRILVRTNQSNATIELRRQDGSSPATANRVHNDGFEFSELSPGQYQLTARLSGWPDISRIITLSSNQDIEVALVFAGGALRLESDPSNAVVRMGGKVVGRTPLVIKDLPPGPQTIMLQYQAWSEVSVSATVEAEKETAKTVRIPYGQLSIDSSPIGALAFIDGEELGRTPVVADQIPAGNRLLRLMADNYEPYENSINIADRSNLRIQPRLTSNIALLDANSLLNSAWVTSQQTGRTYEVAPGFERTTAFRPKNNIVKNLDRQKLYTNWAGRLYRYTGTLKQFDSKTGILEFDEMTGEKSKYKITAMLTTRGRSDKDFLNKLRKGAHIEIIGRLTAIEEPRWPSKTIVLEVSEAEQVN